MVLQYICWLYKTYALSNNVHHSLHHQTLSKTNPNFLLLNSMVIASALGGIVGSFIYQDGSYNIGHAINLSLVAAFLVSTMCLRVSLLRENKRRDEIYGPGPSARAENEGVVDLEGGEAEGDGDRDGVGVEEEDGFKTRFTDLHPDFRYAL
jgi:hypothetical protein